MTNRRGQIYERLGGKHKKLGADRMQWNESVQGFMMNARKTNHLNNCVLNTLEKVAVILRDARVIDLHNNLNCKRHLI